MSSRVSRAAAGAAGDLAARTLPYAPPWALWWALPVLAMMLRGLGKSSPDAGIAVGVILGVVGVGAVVFVFRVFKPRGRDTQLHAAAFAGAAALFVVLGTAAGMWATPDVVVTLRYWYRAFPWLLGVFGWPWAAWFFLALVSAGSWNVRRIARGDGTDHHATADGGFLDKVKLAARPRGAAQLEGDGARVRLPVATIEGTAEDVAKAAGDIAARAGVRRDGVRVEIDPDNHANADIVVTPRDQLRDTRTWPGPRHPGESIGLEIVAAVGEDGEPGRLWLPGDPKIGRNASHIKTAGMPGAGKTEHALTVYGEVLPRADVSVVWTDYVKGLQSCADVAQGMALVLTTKPAAFAAYRKLAEVIRGRTAILGRHGFKQWTPEAGRVTGLKFLVYHVEEAADMLAGSSLIAALSEQARSAGVLLWLSAQRWTHDRIPTSARSNFSNAFTFGLNDESEAEYAMNEQALAAGAAPWIWQNEKPGYHYPQVIGTPRKRWAMAHRAELAEAGHLREVVREWCPIERTELDPHTAALFGDVFAAYRRDVLAGRAEWQQAAEPVRVAGVDVPRPRKEATPAAAGAGDEREEGPAMERDEPVDDGGLSAGTEADGQLAPAGPVVSFAGESGTELELDEEDADGDGQEDDTDGQFVRRAQPEPGLMDDADPADSLRSDYDALPFGQPAPAAPEIGPTEARERLKAELRRLADEEGRATIRPLDLVEWRKTLPRSAGWLTTELQRLVDAGELRDHPDRGVYALPERVPA